MWQGAYGMQYSQDWENRSPEEFAEFLSWQKKSGILLYYLYKTLQKAEKRMTMTETVAVREKLQWVWESVNRIPSSWCVKITPELRMERLRWRLTELVHTVCISESTVCVQYTPPVSTVIWTVHEVCIRIGGYMTAYSFHPVWGGSFFYRIGNSSYSIKNAPRGSHCGGMEDVAIATRRRRRVSQAKLFVPL